MESTAEKKIGIIGGGPAALFMLKRLLESQTEGLAITIFERTNELGAGMPYSVIGARPEHVTNVSDNELPQIVTSVREWLPSAPKNLLRDFAIDETNFNEYKVLPRLLFGAYLSAQFDLLLEQAKREGVSVDLQMGSEVVDIRDEEDRKSVQVITSTGDKHRFDAIVVCTGHSWPKTHEGKIPNWFDSPYPPQKLVQKLNVPVAVKGASLTAIDAVRTLARANGDFFTNDKDELRYKLHEGSEDFKLVLHSLGGLLPALRFHLEDSHLSHNTVMTEEEVYAIKESNGGFVPLDYIFDRNFRQPLRHRNPEFYEQVKDLGMEDFVERVMSFREQLDAFTLLKAEFAEAEKSIRRRQSVNWKEELAVLSYAMNYPAKHLSAEDMLRLKKTLMPLIAIVIAFIPQSSAKELMCLHEAGVLELVAVDRESTIEPREQGGGIYHYTDEEGTKRSTAYDLYVNATGQPQFSYSDFPFESLRLSGTVSPAWLRFQSADKAAEMMEQPGIEIDQQGDGNYYLKVPGISINDHFQVLDRFGSYNDRIYMMAVPYIGGLNPDYSGLDFCEAASARILAAMLPQEASDAAA